MACSKFEYVKKFEKHEQLLPETYTVVRIDGKGFTKFCERHKFRKPNDLRCIQLMSAAAEYAVTQYQDIFIAYGQSDEYSFGFRLETELFNRRSDKIATCVTSCFTAAFMFNWKRFFEEVELKEPPVFDGRCVSYPNLKTLKDYFKWRQADCHINNLYNTTFWSMVKSGKSNTEVESILKDTNSGDKNEILFRDFGTNYNNIEPVYRKGTIIAYFQKEQKQHIESQRPKREPKTEGKTEQPPEQKPQQKKEQNSSNEEVKEPPVERQAPPELELPLPKKEKKPKRKFQLQQRHIDLIKDDFWDMIRMD